METSEAPMRPVSTALFARDLLREYHRSIVQYDRLAASGDVAAIHDMRVGIRRLRVALDNFAVCLTKKERKRLRSTLENLANALGAVRDLDVMIEALKLYRAGKPGEDSVEIGAFIRRLRARRRRRLRQLTDYLQSKEYSEFRREFSANIRTAINDCEEVPCEQAA